MESVSSISQSKDQFLQLLVTQLRHQNPMEPTKQEDFLAQLAQFSSVEQLEELNSKFDGFLTSQSDSQGTQNENTVGLQQFQSMASAANFIGKQVTFESGVDGQTLQGTVSAVVIENDSVFVRVDEQLVPIDQIQEVRPEPTIVTPAQVSTPRTGIPTEAGGSIPI